MTRTVEITPRALRRLRAERVAALSRLLEQVRHAEQVAQAEAQLAEALLDADGGEAVRAAARMLTSTASALQDARAHAAELLGGTT